MSKKAQSTSLQKSFGQAFERLEDWSMNPWRRYSLFLIVLFTSFFLGSSIGTINGALALMDPVGAFFTVLILEIMVRLRRSGPLINRDFIVIKILDVARVGLLYGLLMDGFKLL